ncbi:hypothetical protein BVC80_1687g39 [Macleaya cordata]|uniref:Uncharacterized protein n=1 Tax=Macleaya cordata TaxID=56857 RepID=A0A200RAV6_MACCD|nr:hypothetical protein BVC80_1687g39 [Macleaya cordata]
MMPKGGCCTEKAVLVTVYVERPTIRRRNSPIRKNHHHCRQYQLHHHHTIKRTVIVRRKINNGGAGRGGGGGYDRRAELLHYSHRLRESARSATSTPVHPTPVYASHTQQSLTKIESVRGNKHKYSGIQTCLGKLKILIPSFLSSLASFHAKSEEKKNKKKHKGSSTTTNKITAIMKTLEAQKKCGFISKLFFTCQTAKGKLSLS